MCQIARRVVTICLGLMVGLSIAATAQAASAADFLFQLGEKYYEQKDYQQALHELKKALLAEPQHLAASMLIKQIEAELAGTKGVSREQALSQALDEAGAKMAAEKEMAQAEQAAAEPAPEEAVPQAQYQTTPPKTTSPGELYETVKEKQTLIELYDKYYWYNTKFDGSGKRKRWDYNGRYHEVRTELKLEHNLTENWNILCAIPYKAALWKDDYNRDTTSGIGDVWLNLKYKLFDQATRPVYFALQPGIRFPGGYDEHASVALGKGEVAAEARLITARSFACLPLYSKLELAYRFRAEEPTDEIPYYLELSYYPQNWLMLKSTIDGVEGLAGTGEIEEDWTKWTAHLILSPNNAFGKVRDERIWKFEFAYGNTFEGKNTANGSETVINISYEF